jgi:hypothetical protein
MTQPSVPPQPLPGYSSNYRTPPADDTIATLIPYRNSQALISYYLGVFAIIPCVGFFLGVAAVVLGIRGLKVAGQNPQAKGKVHAIVGIVCGSVFGLLWLLAGVFMLIGLIAAANGR